ncbi:MAG: DUF6624 domain-containing protein [Candidatus Nanoarchaeia archaeon]|jgi:hypothetical protein
MELNKKLLGELSKRFRLDQKLLKKRNWEKSFETAAENTLWLKGIIKKYGWPSAKLVETTGEQYAWLLAQHSDDLSFQEKCLGLLKKMPSTIERRGHIAYLTDRILIKKKKKQIYGTQFMKNKPYPIKDKANLDKRRKKAGLEPFSEYYKIMREKQK